MRHALAVPCALLITLAAGCGGDKTKTVTVTASAPTTVTPTTTTPPPTTTSASGAYRTPRPGEGRLTITGNVTDGQTRRLPGTGDLSRYTYFVLQPEDGSAPLRIAAAGDLDIDPQVRAAIVDPRCGGKLRGTFTVAAAPARPTAYDWDLISARLLNNCSRA